MNTFVNFVSNMSSWLQSMPNYVPARV